VQSEEKDAGHTSAAAAAATASPKAERDLRRGPCSGDMAASGATRAVASSSADVTGDVTPRDGTSVLAGGSGLPFVVAAPARRWRQR